MTNFRYEHPLALPRLSADEVSSCSQTGVWVQPPEHFRRFFRYGPEFIDDPDSVKIFDRIGPAIYRSPPIFVGSYQKCSLIGYRSILLGEHFVNDEVLLDQNLEARFFARFSNVDRFLNEETGLTYIPDEGHWILDRQSRPVTHVTKVAVLSSEEPGNYGSFIFRTLPKIITLRNIGLHHLPMLVWAGNPSFLRLLALLGIDTDQIIQHDPSAITLIDQAICPSLRNPHAYLDRESWAMFQTVSDLQKPSGRGKRLYISRMLHGQRSGYATRVMINEAQFAAALQTLGFEIIEPQTLSIDEQIGLFSSADIVVGPSGSAMFNCVFSRPGTKIVDIESEPDWIYAHAGLFSSCQLRYGLIMGKFDPSDARPVHKRWSLNVPAAVDRIRDFIHS